MTKRSKRIPGIILSVIMAMSLAGCGIGSKTPDARELAGKIGELDLSGYYDMAMSVNGTVEADGVASTVGLSAQVESDGNVSHIRDLSISFSAEGMAFTMSGEAWTDRGSETAYMNLKFLGEESGWTKSDMDEAELDVTAMGDAAGSLKALVPDENAEPVLEILKDTNEYAVTWNVDPGVLNGLLDGLADAAEGSLGNGAGVKIVSAEALFDMDSQDLKSIKLSSTSAEGAELTVYIGFNAIGGNKALSVPSEVIDAASENDAGNGWDVNYDDEMNTGTTGDDDDGSDWLTLAEGGYLTDGDGYDEVIDGMAKAAAGRVDGDNIMVLHYSGYAEMTIRIDNDDWSGEIGVRNITDHEYTSAEDEFISEESFLDGWYDSDQKIIDDNGYCMWLKSDEADILKMQGDLVVSISAYTYDPAGQDMFESYAAELMAIAGLD